MKKAYLENSGRYINDLLRFDYFSKNSNIFSNGLIPLGIGTLFLFSIGIFGFYRFNIPNENLIIFVSAVVIGGYMALNIGANDVANNMGPAVGGKVIKETSFCYDYIQKLA